MLSLRVFWLSHFWGSALLLPMATSAPLTLAVILELYSTRSAFRVLKAYRAASSRVTKSTPLKVFSRLWFRPRPMAFLATLMDQLGPV